MILLLLFCCLVVTPAGRKRRLGFVRKGKTSFTVHRIEEVLPDDVRHLVKQGSSASSDGEGSQDGDRFENTVPLLPYPYRYLSSPVTSHKITDKYTITVLQCCKV
jgi:hypothetical protein